MEAPERGTLSGVYIDLPMPRDTQHPCEGSGQGWAKHVDQTFLSRLPFPGFFDHFVIAWVTEQQQQSTGHGGEVPLWTFPRLPAIRQQ